MSNQTTPSAQPTTSAAPFADALVEFRRAHEQAVAAVLAADHLLAWLSAYASDPTPTTQELLATSVARTLDTVHAALADAGIPAISANAFVRFVPNENHDDLDDLRAAQAPAGLVQRARLAPRA